ncbi:MAG: ATP-binding protein [Bacteroidales bacterium]|nr:ATP-binding protein [Bacteroidales bacterium]
MANRPDNLKQARAYFTYACLLIVLASLLDIFFTSPYYHQLLHRRFQERFLQAENELELQLDEITSLLATNTPDTIFSSKHNDFRRMSSKQKIYFYVYQADSVLLWSDNRIPEIDILPFITDYQQFIQLSNGWFYAISRTIKEYKIIGLLLIKDNFVIKNQYLSNEFNPIFHMPASIGVRSNIFREQYLIKNIHGAGVFSLDFSRPLSYKGVNLAIIPLLLLLAIALFVYALHLLLNSWQNERKKNLITIGFSIFLIGLYLLIRLTGFPTLLMELNAFKQAIFTSGKFNLFPSDIFICALISYLSIYLIYSRHKLDKPQLSILNTILQSVIVVVFFNSAAYLFELTLLHTNITYNITEFFSEGMVSIVIITSFTMLFSSFLLLIDLCVRNAAAKNFLLFAIIMVLMNLVFTHLFLREKIVATAIFTLTFLFIIYLRRYKKQELRYSHILMILGLFSFYAVYVIFKIGSQRIANEEKELAQNLAVERDKVAELLLSDLNKKIAYDTTLYRQLFRQEIDYPWIYKYIKKRYFSGYLDRYDVQLTICHPNDSVLIKPSFQLSPCFAFFDSIIHTHAEKINSNFYFLKNFYGRISYFGLFPFRFSGKLVNVYLQLESRLNTDVLGYPQLLLSQYEHNDRLKKYSYAKYYKDVISYQSGSFIYNTSTEKYPKFNGPFHYEKFSGYNHLFFRPNPEVLIILSRQSPTFIDLLVSFSYLFIINFFLFNLMFLLANKKSIKLNILQRGFRMRIQLTIIGILLFSLLFVAGITVYFILQQYSRKYYEAFGEKLQSIYLELYNNLSQEDKLSYIWHSDQYSNLESFLQHLSNLFSTDIHLYGNDGRLIASSRVEIFEKGICSNRINPIAYYQLTRNSKIEYVQNEWIGKQKYFSIYTPLVNRQGKIIAYVNLPYFTQQSKLSEEISTFLLAIINVYIIFLVIAITIAVVTANKLTRPLQIVQESIAQMKLGKGNIKIQYQSQDELGNLIDEYNKKVEELEHSVEILSKVERESAWREMARQVAHEIKNPLTPIKLSIQQLQRRINSENKIDVDYFQKVTQAIIEQIDNLSNIATAFSNLAQMPTPKKTRINLNDIVEEVVSLYQDTKINFEINLAENGCWILADKEQMRRVLINLINNALQAFTQGGTGTIYITLKGDSQRMVIVEDNGSGVPPEIRDKLFQPNFTTKTSGSGLGLAICKSIVEYIGGSIRYEPRQPSGSRFIIAFPVSE